jgi:hypothetical protein
MYVSRNEIVLNTGNLYQPTRGLRSHLSSSMHHGQESERQAIVLASENFFISYYSLLSKNSSSYNLTIYAQFFISHVNSIMFGI